MLSSLLLSLALACGDEDPPTDGGVDGAVDGALEDALVDAPIDHGPPPPSVEWEFEVVDLVSGDSLPGATLCVFDVPAIPCVTTDETGVAHLAIPINARVRVETTSPIYFPVITNYDAEEEPERHEISVVKSSQFMPLLAVAGISSLDPEKGHIAFLAQSSPGSGLEGMSAALEPASGEGPFYTDGSFPNNELEATTSDGLGVYANVDPGAVTLRYSGPATCRASEGWDEGEDALGLEVAPGHLHIVIALCPVSGDVGI